MSRFPDKLREKYVRCLELPEEEDTKRDQLLLLRETIKQYLYQDHPTNKFTLSLFFELLEFNVENKDDFTLLGAMHAFDALEKYALNLLFSPWRHEYRTIKLFGGYYKHKVSRHLNGAEKILQLMNYKFKDSNTLVLEGSIDEDNLIEIALNCLIASVECDVIQENVTALRRSGISCGHKEVFKLRTSYPSRTVCRTTTSRNLLNENPERSSSRSCVNGVKSKSDVAVDQLVDLSSEGSKIAPDALYETVRKRDKTSQYTNASSTAPPKPVPLRNVNKNVSKEKDKMSELFKPDTHEHHIQSSVSTVKEQAKMMHDQPATRAESWDYIDRTLQNNADYDLRDELAPRRPQATQTELNQMELNQFYPQMYHPYSIFLQTAAFPVVRPPVYTNFVARPPPGYEPVHSYFPADPLWSAMYNRVNDENFSPHLQERSYANYADVGGSNRNSYYDNVASDRERTPEGTSNNRHRSSKSQDTYESYPSPPSPFGMDDEMLLEIDGPQPKIINTNSNKSTKNGKSGKRETKEKTPQSSDKTGSGSSARSSIDDRSGGSSESTTNQWQCKYCTFFNESEATVCTMCGRSKNKGAEATPLKTGGKVCSKCTLVNETDAKICAACETALDGSSTYV